MIRGRICISKKHLAIFWLSVFIFIPVFHVVAADEIDRIQTSIEEKERRLNAVMQQISFYQKKIQEQHERKASLTNDLELLENRIAKTELDQEATNQSIDLVNDQLILLEHESRQTQQQLHIQKELMKDVLHRIQSTDDVLPLLLYFGSDSLSTLFSSLDQLQSISSDLKKSHDYLSEIQTELQKQTMQSEKKREEIVRLKKELEKTQTLLENEVASKEKIISLTNQSEREFQKLLSDVKEEQNAIGYQISQLQQDIEEKLRNEQPEVGENQTTTFAWPVVPAKGISTYYHDPTYPFRHLFEHSGLDIPAPKGTPIKSASSGYVAWAKVGRLYGNYVMIIHSNGFATLYAHMSRVDVVADQYITQGEVIGAVGSTGLSTGPHLHFELREEGIPIDPYPHLPK